LLLSIDFKICGKNNREYLIRLFNGKVHEISPIDKNGKVDYPNFKKKEEKITKEEALEYNLN